MPPTLVMTLAALLAGAAAPALDLAEVKSRGALRVLAKTPRAESTTP